MTTPVAEPLSVEVSKTLHKIIKNAAKKDVDIKASGQKALGMLHMQCCGVVVRVQDVSGVCFGGVCVLRNVYSILDLLNVLPLKDPEYEHTST
jgi:hypothetical protein